MKKLIIVLLFVLALPLVASGQEWLYYVDEDVRVNILTEYMSTLPKGNIGIKTMVTPLKGAAMVGIYDLDISPTQAAPVFFESVMGGTDKNGEAFILICATSTDGDPYSDYGLVFTYNPALVSSERLHAIAYCQLLDITQQILLGDGFAEIRATQMEKANRINATITFKGGMTGSLFSGTGQLQLLPD